MCVDVEDTHLYSSPSQHPNGPTVRGEFWLRLESWQASVRFRPTDDQTDALRRLGYCKPGSDCEEPDCSMVYEAFYQLIDVEAEAARRLLDLIARTLGAYDRRGTRLVNYCW